MEPKLSKVDKWLIVGCAATVTVLAGICFHVLWAVLTID